jgi:Tfp pilus assembly protein FimT
MTTVQERQDTSERKALYIVVGLVVAVLVVVGLFTFRSAKSTAEAEQKADQLISELQSVGARAPSQDTVVRLLGDDGGFVCKDPNSALRRASLLAGLANGAGGPGARATIADSRVVQGELLVIKVYCPDELAEFQEFVDGLKLESTSG